MSEAGAMGGAPGQSQDGSVDEWPGHYRPEWFAAQTMDDEAIFLSVYTDLRLIARHLLCQEFSPPSLQATELVNEAFIKLLQQPVTASSRRHLLNILARYMRQLLIDRGRRRRSGKHAAQLTGLDTHIGRQHGDPDWLLFDQMLDRLQQSKPVLYEVFQLHYFSELRLADIAQLMSCSERTVKRYWMAAKLWLTQRVSQQY